MIDAGIYLSVPLYEHLGEIVLSILIKSAVEF
jgi:hypothetical protein